MSLINFILQDKLLLGSIAVVGALIVLGVLLMVISAVRRLILRNHDAAEDDIDAVTAELVEDSDEIDILLPVVQAAPAPMVSAAETPKPDTDMQKILNTVFTDEDHSSRRKLLFEGLEKVDIHALALMAKETANRLGVKAKSRS